MDGRDRRIRLSAFALVSRMVVVILATGMLSAVVVQQPEPATAAVSAAKNAVTPKPAPLQPGAQPNRGLPMNVEPVREPPRGAPAGAPVSAARGRALDRAQNVEQVAAAQAIGPLAAASRVLLRPGYLLGDTSLIVYFDADDFDPDPTSWTRWYATVTDVETGQEQRSIFFGRNDPGRCGRPAEFCRTFGATDGWVLEDGRQYTATVTVERPGGILEESAPSNVARARQVVDPPGVPAAQAAGCACPNVLTRAPGLQALRGNLVNTATGAMVRTEDDLSLPSYGIPFQAVRIYSSSNPFQGMFGPGWSWTYDARVISAAGPDVRVHADDGQEVVFNSDGQGGFTRPPGVQSRLARAGTGWTLTTADQRTLAFDSAGRLLSVRNQRGNGVVLAYAADGRLTTLTDAAGRVVRVDMDATSKRIRSLTLPDGRSVAYTYDASSRLATVRDARLGTWRYAYDAVGRLASVTDPLSRPVVRSTYDAGGRVTSQTDALGAVTRFSWTPATGSTPGVAVTVDPDGVRVEDRYQRNVLLGTTIGPDAVDPDAETGNLVYRYDSRLHRNLTVDEQANQSSVSFDDDGNALRTRAADPFAYIEVNEYDTRNNLVRHEDRRGQEWTYSYNAQNEMIGQADPSQGRVANGDGYRYTFDSRGLVTSRRDPLGNVTTYELDAAGNRTAEITPTGRRTEFEYDRSGRMTAIVDPRGTGSGAGALTRAKYTTRTTFDAEDRPISSLQPGNLLPTIWQFDAAGQMVATTDPLGRTVRYRYDAVGRLTESVDARGKVSRKAYTAAGRNLSITDALGNRTSWTYNARGQVLTETTPRGNALADRGGSTAEVAAYRNRFRYDQRGNRIAVERVMPDGATTRVQTAFDELSRPTGQIDELNRTTGARYNANGDVTDLIDENGETLRQTYDEAGRRTSSANLAAGAKGLGAEITYNRIGNPTSQVLPTGGKVTWDYDKDGRPTGITEPRGNAPGASPADYTTTYTYDAAGNLTAMRDPLGNTTRTEYDQQDRVVARTGADGAITRYAYDDADQVYAVAGPVKGAVADTLSQLFLAKVALVSGKGPVNGTILNLTGLDAPVNFAIGQITGVPMSRYGYDLNGNVVAAGDQLGRVRRTLYDDLNRPSASADPLGRARAYGYDADSNLTTVQTASNVPGLALSDGAREARTMRSTYDSLGRLTRTDQAGGPSYTYGYDANERLVSAADPAGTTAYDYDNTGLVERITRNGRTFSYEYDDSDNLTQRTYPDGTVVRSTYDEGDRMDSLTTTRQGSSQQFTFGYDLADRLTRTTYPGSTGAVENRAYDRAGRLSAVTAGSPGGVRADYTLARDQVGNPTRIETARRSGSGQPLVQEVRSYAYDASQRLTAACYGATTCGSPLLDRSAERWDYDYDLVGNRTKESYKGSDLTKNKVTAYTYDPADQLKLRTTIGAGAGIVSFDYDGEGNQTREGGDRFAYNLDHTLASATTGGNTTQFGYDALGQRVSGTTGTGAAATTRTWEWDVLNELPMLAGESGGGVGSRAYTYGPDGAQLAMYAGAGAQGSVFTHDWLGGTSAVLGANGAGQWAYDYDPFGNPRGTGLQDGGVKLAPNAPANPFQYAGGYNDSVNSGQSGNYHLRARDYDPQNGRFTGTDPVSRPAGGPAGSSYSYVDGRATAAVDPSGMEYVEVAPGVSIFISGVNADWTLTADTSGTGGGVGPDGEPVDLDPLAAEREAAQKVFAEAENFTRQIGDELIGLVADLIGINDAKNCFTNGDVGACVNTALQAVPWGKLFKAAKVAFKAIGLGRRLVEGFSRLRSARAALEAVVKRADEAATAARQANKRLVAEARAQAAKKLAQVRARAQAAKEAAVEAKRKAVSTAGNIKQKLRDTRSPGCKPANSFAAGTLVVMADGSTKPIEDVKPGDSVLASPETGPESGAPQPRPVTATITGDGVKHLVDLSLVGAGSGGGGPPARASITATAGHPMFVPGTGWVEAGSLAAGQYLVEGAGRLVEVAAAAHRTAVTTVYNLTVADRHTYLVQDAGVTVLTHNTGVGASGEACKISSRGARRQAMREAGIPTSQQFDSQLSTEAGYQYVYRSPVAGGGERTMVVTDQTTDRVVGHGPHWEAGPAKTPIRFDPLNRIRVTNQKAKVEYGAGPLTSP